MTTHAATVWRPSEQARADSRLARYMAWVSDRQGERFATYGDLWSWSVRCPDLFWESIWDYFDIRSEERYDAVLADRSMPGARWFAGATLNYAEHALRDRRHAEPALVEVDERGFRRELSWDDLAAAVGSAGAWLREQGIGRGDVVAAYMPNRVETVIAYLACASVGATWASCSLELSPAAAHDRLDQLAPAVLLAGNGYPYGGRVHDRRDAVAELIGSLSGEPLLVVVEHEELGPPAGVDGQRWEAVAGSPREPEFERVPFAHPLCVLFSSGTTGKPKGIVHGHGGLLLDHLRHHALHLDLGPHDTFSFFTNTSWMVWNWLVAGLLVGSTVVLYDGSPTHPQLDSQFALAARERVTVMGTSASYVTACAKAGLAPGRDHDLDALRALVITGSPLPAASYHWVADSVGAGVWPVSSSGGTDVCSAFVSGCPLLPVRAGEIQCRCLGAGVEVFDEAGRAVVGEVGELVITTPLPSMPVAFWGDGDGSAYRATYFEDFPGVWRHGDLARLSEEGSVRILGRSDATLNRNGVRVGTAEIYEVLDAIPEVRDSLVVGVDEAGGGYWMPLFVVLHEDAQPNDGIEGRIAAALRASASPRHVPDEVRRMAALPRTLTGKRLEVPIKRILMGLPPGEVISREAVSEPQTLDEFAALARERHAAVAARRR
ncbi:MAG TPA: acetoacetate--CoA ligase [Thermoleophilaceae bacterium]|nr:acetoacetate--CoA ligase [Thermoleophilaceae bacterium]